MASPTESGWYYAIEPEPDRVPRERRIEAPDGRLLTRRRHGCAARIEVIDRVGLPVAAWLRAAAAVGRRAEAEGVDGVVRVEIAAGETAIGDGGVRLDPHVIAQRSRFPLAEAVAALPALPSGPLGAAREGPPARRALFFESLMSSDLPHNDTELSQGVLHMISALREVGTEAVLADVKMPIEGELRPVQGLDGLARALEGGPVGLVCVTLLEGYWHGVVQLVRALRALGCRAHVAVGGVMPSLAPEHVAAHLPEVSFVCRGAGEHFVPQLARILGEGSVDVPLTADQRAALLGLDGLIAIDRAGGALLSARSDRTVEVESLDRVPLDLSRLTERHLQGGFELATSRGCVHACTFCSILGRRSYQARSAGGVIELLGRYEERIREIWGEHPPSWAHRVHICDDDFACDRERARTFFTELLRTPFRLSSVQVSVADLCRREGHKLLPEVDTELLDAIRPECFADASQPIPERDLVADHRSRTWSSFLQIGVETYADAELVRLGKGYRVEHVRAVVRALASRGLHMDGYFILANADTSAEDLLDVLDEVCRLKVQHPRWFHVRFPIVPRLVSYFTSASHRRLVRQGRASALVLRDCARVEGYPEYDYPFVDHDRPEDPWVDALDASFFTDEALYTASLTRLRERWLARARTLPPGEERRRGERLLRRLDDRPRRLLFELLARARRAARQAGAGPTRTEARLLASARRVLGPEADWLPAFRRYASDETPRMVVIPTWQCELRCGYCFIPKQDGRVMRPETLEAAVDMLLASDREALVLQFFGGEALLEWPLVQHGIAYGAERAAALGKRLDFVLSSNGWSLDAEKLAWLSGHAVKLELSLDGDRSTQNLQRPAAARGADSYDNGIAHRAAMIRASGLRHEVIMVVHPRSVARMPANFFHIVELGFPRVQINFALGFLWSKEQQEAFAAGLFAIGRELKRRWAVGEAVAMVNLESDPMAVRLNGEITVDWDGTIHGGNVFLHETEHRSAFVLGRLGDLGSFDRCWMDAPDNEALLARGYPEEVTRNNLEVGRIMQSFVRWMRSGGIPEPRPAQTAPS